MTTVSDRFSVGDMTPAHDFFDENGYVIFTDAFYRKDLEDFRLEVGNIINSFLIKAGAAQLEPRAGAVIVPCPR